MEILAALPILVLLQQALARQEVVVVVAIADQARLHRKAVAHIADLVHLHLAVAEVIVQAHHHEAVAEVRTLVEAEVAAVPVLVAVVDALAEVDDKIRTQISLR